MLLLIRDVPDVMTLILLATCETEKEVSTGERLRTSQATHNCSNGHRIQIAPASPAINATANMGRAHRSPPMTAQEHEQ
jgi:hypothetical protein